jgi:hypothetical protein
VWSFLPSLAQADIIVTSASGYVDYADDGTFGYLDGPDATLDLGSGRDPIEFFTALAGAPFQPDPSAFEIPTLDAAPFSVLSGDVTVDGQTYGVVYRGDTANLTIYGSVIVPTGYASVQLAAVFEGGGGSGCLDIAGFFSCSPPPPEVPVIVEGAYFLIPGTLTVNFSPEPPQAGPNVEFFDAEFDPGSFPVPEPSSALLVLFALTAAAIWRLYAQRRAAMI